MRFRCPSCGLRGVVRIPEYYPRGKTVPVRCSRCRRRFPLTLGRLWPQSAVESYDALLTGTRDCPGETIGGLWVEAAGAPAGEAPLVVLPSHPGFPHEIMHDLVDPLAELTRLCFLELQGYGELGGAALESFLLDLRVLRGRLKAPGFHLLGHLYSAVPALQAARSLGPEVCRSLLLVAPDLGAAAPMEGRPGETRLLALLREEGPGSPAGGPPADEHLRGLASLLAPRASPALLKPEPAAARPEYGELARLAVPTLIFTSRDACERRREDALFLGSVLPGAVLEELGPGGAWSAWLSGDPFLSRAARFLARQAAPPPAPPARPLPPPGAPVARGHLPAVPRRLRAVCGQPAGAIAALSLLSSWALAVLMSGRPYQPAFMRQVVPVLAGALLPVAWFLLPRGLPLPFLFRLDRWKGAAAPIGLWTGLLSGAAWGLLLRLGYGSGWAGWPARFFGPAGLFAEKALPLSFLFSPPPGSPGRLWLSAALIPAALLMFGFLGNLLALRRAGGRLLLPALLFALLPPLLPDLLWRFPLGLAAAFLFSRSLCAYPPLLMVAGFEAGGRLLARLDPGRLPPNAERVLLAGPTGFAAAFLLLLLGALPLFAAFRWAAAPAAVKYAPACLRRDFRWRPAWGVMAVVLGLLGTALLVVGFLEVGIQ